ncbi:hypothetical protein RYX36_027471 [Vicia faba]
MNGAVRTAVKVSGDHKTSPSSLDLNGGSRVAQPPYDSSYVLATRSSRHEMNAIALKISLQKTLTSCAVLYFTAPWKSLINSISLGVVLAYNHHQQNFELWQEEPNELHQVQGHSGVESFYGPPTGFIGPFIAPPGGIPGVQGPPHMVVYNHFAPVGQFGQVGLSFMGTTHIPSGKQPDWKHIPTTSAAGTSEGHMNNMNMTSSQRNPASMPSQIQHLAPGSPLLPMASPVAMYDVSPFQHSTEMSVQARWPHVPNAPLSSIPPSMPLHQQESVQTSQMSHGPSVDQSLNVLLTPAANAPLSPPTIPFVNEPPMSSSASDEVATNITTYDIYLQPLIGHHQFGRPQSGTLFFIC